MDADSKVSRVSQEALIRELGEHLDRNVFPSVRTGGVLVPATTDDAPSSTGTENGNGGSSGSSVGSRKGTARRQRSSGRSSNPASPAIGEQLRRLYEAQVDAIERAYPGTQVWTRDDGMWLLVKSTVIDGLPKAATFLVLLPYIEGMLPQGWGFWRSDSGYQWIGPRHTNFPAGSICAYTIEDGTWSPGGDVRTLLDLYTLWAFRHLHVEIFDRWPGYHSAPHPYERIVEFKETEYCGCGSVGVLYVNCCRGSDHRHNLGELAMDFRRRYSCQLNERRPPSSVVETIEEGEEPPTATTIQIEINDMARPI
jgi:hypothetical protein